MNKIFCCFFGLFFLFILAVALAEEAPIAPDSPGEIAEELVVLDSRGEIAAEPAADAFTLSLTASPLSGIAPLQVIFSVVSDSQDTLTFAWDFNSDGIIDNSEKNPVTTFNDPGDYTISVTATGASNQTVTKSLQISVAKNPAAGLEINSYFPNSFQEGENEITVILVNNGQQTISDITGKIIGEGIRHLSSTSVSALRAGDEDTLNIKAQFLRNGSLSAMFKIAGRNFPVNFEISPSVQYSKEELQARFTQLKEVVQEQENVYYDKKAQGYLVSEIFESIKEVKHSLQNAQQSLLTADLTGAAVSLDLISPTVEDITADLKNAKKQKQTLMMWMKENAVAITAIIAALGTLSSLLIKLTSRAKKLGEDVKHKVIPKKNPTPPTTPMEAKEEPMKSGIRPEQPEAQNFQPREEKE